MSNKKKRVKPCPICHCDMILDREKKGGVFRRSRKYWVCTEVKLCGHKELNEGEKDRDIRMGGYDELIGILPLVSDND